MLGAQERLRASRRKLPSFEASLAGDIAYAYHLNGLTDDADRQYAVAMQLHRDIGRGESPAAVAILNNWCIACVGAGDIKRALALNDEVLRTVTKRSPNGTPPPYAVNNRVSTLITLARFDEAWGEAERAWHIADQAGADVFKLSARAMQASILRERGDLDAAATILADVAPDAAVLPHDSFAVIAHKRGCAHIALLRGHFEEAAAAIEPVIRLFEERDMRVGVLVIALRLRAEIRWAQGNLATAMADARHALAIAEELRGGNPCSSLTGQCSLLLARLERAAGHPQEADAALRNAIAHLPGALGDDHPETRLAFALIESTPSVAAPNVASA